jgi:hypothetical protein
MDKQIEEYLEKNIEVIDEEICDLRIEVRQIKKTLDFIVEELIKKGLGNI